MTNKTESVMSQLLGKEPVEKTILKVDQKQGLKSFSLCSANILSKWLLYLLRYIQHDNAFNELSTAVMVRPTWHRVKLIYLNG